MPGREFLVVDEGVAVAERDGEEVQQVGPGDFFGEVPLLVGALTAATVTAATDMRVLAMNRRDLLGPAALQAPEQGAWITGSSRLRSG